LFISEIQAVPTAGVFQQCGTIDEEHHVIHIMFLAEFGKERAGENVVFSRFERCME
jgi:hypothetical protein